MNQVKFKKKNKACFLDRDGVINKDIGYLHKVEDFQWIEGAKEAIKFLNKKKFKDKNLLRSLTKNTRSNSNIC